MLLPFGNVPFSLPAQTGNSGKYLTTNGSVVSWGTVAAGGGQSPYTKIVAATGGDYTTLGAALAAAVAGTTIYVMPGTYVESAQTITVDNVRVIGANPESTIINLGANNWTINTTTVNGTQPIRFEGLQFTIGAGIFTFSAHSGEVVGCRFIFSSGGGSFKLNGAQQLFQRNIITSSVMPTTNEFIFVSNLQGVRVIGNKFRFSHSGTTALGFLGSGGNDMLILGNEFWNDGTPNCPMVRFYGAGGTIQGNVFIDNGGGNNLWGIDAQGGSTSIVGNTFDGTHACGVLLSNSNNQSVVGNTFNYCYRGVISQTALHNIVGNNFISPAATYIGIELQAGSSRCIVANNILKTFATGIKVTVVGNTNNLLQGNILNTCTTPITDNGTTTTSVNNITT